MSPGNVQPIAPIPPVYQRLLYWFALPFVCALVLAAASQLLPALAVMDTAGPWGRLLFVFTILVPTLTTLGVMLWGDRRIKRAVRATGGRSCTVCLYDLCNLGDTGTCPECGRPFDTAADRAMWGRVNILK